MVQADQAAPAEAGRVAARKGRRPRYLWLGLAAGLLFAAACVNSGGSAPAAPTAANSPGASAAAPAPAANNPAAPMNPEGSAGANQPAYRNPTQGFSVTLPNGWAAAELPGGLLPFPATLFTRGEEPTSLLVASQNRVTAAQLLAQIEQTLEVPGGGIRRADQGQVTIAGQTWQVRDWQAAVDGADTRVRVWTTQRGDTAWVLLGTGLAHSWDSDLPRIEATVNSLMFL